MRTAFLKTLYELAEKDTKINLIIGDLGFSVVESFAEKMPNQFLNAGIAEQNMTGVAVGMALSGKIVFTYSICNFPTLRCLEQIRNDICYHKADVKIVAVGGGIAYGNLGSSHQSGEDLAIMRSLPEMTVVAPADPIETKYAAQALAYKEGPCYLRLGKAGEPIVHKKGIDFQIGRAILVKDGKDITFISTGSMLKSCIEAADKLNDLDISARVLSMHTIKPIDCEAIYKAAEETNAIITVEEHNIIGGLGGAVSEVLAQSGKSIKFQIMGFNDIFCRKVGNQEYLRNEYGLSVNNIVDKAKNLLHHCKVKKLDAELPLQKK